MKAMLCRVFAALLCVLLLAGCGAKAQSTRQNPLESPAGAKAERFDPPETARAAVDIRTSPFPSGGRRRRRARKPSGRWPQSISP